MTTTNFLGLNTYDTASGSLTTFLSYRLATNGLSSNMTTIDAFAQATSASIAQIKAGSIATINASQISTNYFEATNTAVTSYLTNMPINLKLNTTISGSATLNINAYGVKGLKKIDTSGSIINMVNGDLISGRYYSFIYDGTQFVLGGYDAGTGGSTYTGSGVITVSGSVISSTLQNSPFITSGSDSNLSNYRMITAGSYITITSASANGGAITISGSTPGHNIYANGSYQAQRRYLGFTGRGYAFTDNTAGSSTEIKIPLHTRIVVDNPNFYSWVSANMGTSTFDWSGGQNTFFIEKTSGSDVAVASYSFSGSSYATGYGYFGLQTFDYQKSGFKFGFMETSSSKLACVGVAADGTLTYENWDSPTSFSASAVQKINAIKNLSDIFFYIKYDLNANTRKYYFSIDGYVTTLIYSTTANNFLTPNAWFFGVVKDVEDVMVKMYSFEPYSS